jgi:voltage-gated potassium channel Kch
MSAQRERTGRSYLLRAIGACTMLVVIYYLAPVEPDVAGVRLVVRAAGMVAAAVVMALLVARLVTRLVRDDPGVRPASLLVALFGGVVLFAFVDYMIAISSPGQFHDLRTKTDALYFAVTTLATVGYGDVYASGQLARAVVIGQLLFNLAVLATGGAVLVGRITAGQRRDREGPPRSSP